MADELHGMKVAFITANEGVERVELTEPWQAVIDAGGQPDLISPKVGDVQTFDHLTKAETRQATVATTDARADEYVGVVLPGGVANPDQLRLDQPAVELLRTFADAGSPIAVICHGPWTLIEAGLVHGRTITSWPSLRTDLQNAGATWIDDELVECENGPFPLLSSRKPDDLPAFCAAMVRACAARSAGARS